MFYKFKNFIDHSYARNVSFAYLMGLFCVTLGSASTALLICAFVTIIFFNIKITFRELYLETVSFAKKMPIVLVFPLFYFWVILTSLQGGDWFHDVTFLAGSYWQFLFMVPATVGLFYLSKDVNFASVFTRGCRFGLLFVVPLSLVQIYFLNLRPEGILSNSLIFASLCIAAAGIAIIEWPEDTQRIKTWSWVVFVSGMVAALLTFSRGMLLPIGLVTLIAIYYFIKNKSRFSIDIKTIGITLACFIGILIASISTDNGWRILNKRIIEPIQLYQKDRSFDRSISQRLDMQLTGFYAFTQKPLTGYGIQNAVQQSNDVSMVVLDRETNYTYTHLHNDYLTHAVGGGIILLILFVIVIFSPVLMTWQFRKDKRESSLFYFSLVLSVAFATIAMTNLVFRNDQLTTMFCVACIFVMVRRLQIIKGVETVRTPDMAIIANGINPIGLKPEKSGEFLG